MISVEPAGTTERMVARSLSRVVRAGLGTEAKYSATVFGFFAGFRPLAVEAPLADFTFFMLGILSQS